MERKSLDGHQDTPWKTHEFSGEEALRLYGIDPGIEVGPVEPSSTQEPWFPTKVWVSASILPYDDPDPILVLPVYADSELGVSSTWVGDLEAGSSMMLLSIQADGRACYIVGRAFQGWTVEGWVACNRLLFSEPTPIVNPDEQINCFLAQLYPRARISNKLGCLYKYSVQRRGSRRSGSMVFHSEEVNRFAYVPKDWTDELSSQHSGQGS